MWRCLRLGVQTFLIETGVVVSMPNKDRGSDRPDRWVRDVSSIVQVKIRGHYRNSVPALTGWDKSGDRDTSALSHGHAGDHTSRFISQITSMFLGFSV